LCNADIESVDPSNDLALFVGVMEAMERCSPDASIFILIHKMDMVAEDDRDREFAERAALVQSKSQQ
jgi:Ras-related GTP-binding protein A/B